MRVVAVFPLLLAACPGGTTTPAQQNPGPTGNTGQMMTQALNYTHTQVTGCGTKTGNQTVIATKGSEVVFVTISELGTTTACMPSMRPPSQTQNYDLCYGETSGANVATQSVAQLPFVALNGVGLAVAPNGTVAVGYTGGPNGAFRCGGTDMLVVTKSGASFGAAQTLATDSAGTPDASEQMDCAVQNICSSAGADATGYWPALAYSPNNQLNALFRDMHFGFAGDDFGKSDVELVRNGGGVRTIDGAKGGGEYLRAAFTSDGLLSVAFYNGEGATQHNGLWVLRENGAGFEHTLITAEQAGESIGFAVTPAGYHMIAWYSVKDKRLKFADSNDGVVWSEPEDVDTNGNIGLYPSLAFDSNGNAAIAYYRCNDYKPNDDACDQSKDGLYLARRSGSSWTKAKVIGDASIADGLYPAITFAGGKAVIAYQKRVFDPSGNTTSSELYLAKEP